MFILPKPVGRWGVCLFTVLEEMRGKVGVLRGRWRGYLEY